ncbi:MAG: division/cell wall cluster transcriptional repressor MraZ [Verrucomicrobiota bacterium]
METVIQQAYTDTFEHNFDEKGRITVPKEWRGSGFEDVLHVIPSKEGCLKVYPGSYLGRKRAVLDEEKAPLDDPRRKALEVLAASIQQVSPDSNHRISIKEKFRDRAQLKKAAALVGKFDHFEIWDAKAWSAHSADELTLEEAAKLAGF